MMMANDPICGEDNVKNTFEAMRIQERKRPRAKHDNAHSYYVKCRKVLVEWIIEVCEAFGLSHITTFHTIDLLDRVFMHQRLNQRPRRKSFQCLAIACIIIATKFNETDDRIPSLQALNSMSGIGLTLDLVRNSELLVLNLLNWEVVCITPICYLEPLLRHTSTDCPETDLQISRLVVLLLGLALQDERCIGFLPSILCAGALHRARSQIHHKHKSPTASPRTDFIIWNSKLLDLTHCTEYDVGFCSNYLAQKYHEFIQLKLSMNQPVDPSDIPQPPPVRPLVGDDPTSSMGTPKSPAEYTPGHTPSQDMSEMAAERGMAAIHLQSPSPATKISFTYEYH